MAAPWEATALARGDALVAAGTLTRDQVRALVRLRGVARARNYGFTTEEGKRLCLIRWSLAARRPEYSEYVTREGQD
jgi:hypothetical protein